MTSLLLQATSDQKVDVSWATDALLGIAVLVLAGLAVILVAVSPIMIVVWRARRRRLAKSGIDDIDRMGGQVFERYLEVLFDGLGYNVERTRFVGDFGGDLVIRKGAVKTVVQAKRYTKSVGVKAVQEAVAAKGYYDCAQAMVVSNSSYTRQAKELAWKNDVVLWDRTILISKLVKVNARDARGREVPSRIGSINGESRSQGQPDALEHAAQTLETDAAPPALADVATCKTCARVLTAGERKYCERNARRFGGMMLCFRHQRSARSPTPSRE